MEKTPSFQSARNLKLGPQRQHWIHLPAKDVMKHFYTFLYQLSRLSNQDMGPV